MYSCYKCGSEENLSIRSQRKSTGYKLYICKHCRNQLAKEYKRKKYASLLYGKPTSLKKTEYIAWMLRSRKSMANINKRFAKVGV